MITKITVNGKEVPQVRNIELNIEYKDGTSVSTLITEGQLMNINYCVRDSSEKYIVLELEEYTNLICIDCIKSYNYRRVEIKNEEEENNEKTI